MYPLVFIIVVNYNGLLDTLECINSLQHLTYKYYRIIIVDNNSTDNSNLDLVSRFQKVKVIQSGNNFGFANGTNIGIKYAIEHNADFIWLLNNDTTVDRHSLQALVNNYSSAINPGIAGSKVLNYYNTNIIDFEGGIFDLKTGYTKHINRNTRDKSDYIDGIIMTQFITGCSMFLSSDVINDIGLMDESYFLYCEDVDWCVRARQKGYELFVVPSSIIYHKISSTTKRNKGSATYYITRNTLFLLQKIARNQKVSWKGRFLTDISRAKKFLFSRNLRGIFNIIRGYWSWLINYHGSI